MFPAHLPYRLARFSSSSARRLASSVNRRAAVRAPVGVRAHAPIGYLTPTLGVPRASLYIRRAEMTEFQQLLTGRPENVEVIISARAKSVTIAAGAYRGKFIGREW